MNNSTHIVTLNKKSKPDFGYRVVYFFFGWVGITALTVARWDPDDWSGNLMMTGTGTILGFLFFIWGASRRIFTGITIDYNKESVDLRYATLLRRNLSVAIPFGLFYWQLFTEKDVYSKQNTYRIEFYSKGKRVLSLLESKGEANEKLIFAIRDQLQKYNEVVSGNV